MTVRRTDAAAHPTSAGSPGPALSSRQAQALSKKLGSGVEARALEDIARLVSSGASSVAGKQLLQLLRTATPAQAAVIHDLVHHRLDGAEFKVPAGQGAYARQVQAHIDRLGGGDDLRAMRTFALSQEHRANLSPAGAKLFDRLREGGPAEAEMISRQITARTASSAARYAGWSPR